MQIYLLRINQTDLIEFCRGKLPCPLLLHFEPCGILIPQSGIKPRSPVLQAAKHPCIFIKGLEWRRIHRIHTIGTKLSNVQASVD